MDDAIKNDALRISMEWGPRRSIPYEQRIAEAHPKLASTEIEQLRKLCGQVESEMWGTIVAHFKAHAQNEAAARSNWEQAIRAKWPWLDDNNLSSGWTQGCYYAWHDGELT